MAAGAPIPPRRFFTLPEPNGPSIVGDETDCRPIYRIDFFARLVGFSCSQNRESIFATVIILDEEIWKTHRVNMKEMKQDYKCNYGDRRGTEETFVVGSSAVVWSITGGKGLFVRVNVVEVKEENGEPVFDCLGWDDGQQYKATLDEIFTMTAEAASYPCIKVQLSLDGLHGYFDYPQLVKACLAVWKDTGLVYGVRNVKPRPNPEPHGPVAFKTYALQSFVYDPLNDIIGKEFLRLIEIDRYKESEMKVTVTHVDERSHVWLQIRKDDIIARIHLLCRQCVLKTAPIGKTHPHITLDELVEKKCCVAVLDDGSCRRATVVDKLNRDQVLAYLIDFGKTEPVLLDNLHSLKEFDPLTMIIGPRCLKAFIHNAREGIKLDEDTYAKMLETVESFAPKTTTATKTGTILADGKEMDVYEIRGVVGRTPADIVNIHGIPYSPRDTRVYRHGHPDDVDAGPSSASMGRSESTKRLHDFVGQSN